MTMTMPQENPKVPAEQDPESLRRSAFWTPQTFEQLVAEQGVSLPQDIDALVGQGADLWEDDEDFERFVAGINERRRHAGEPMR